MTRENLKKLIAILQAHSEGKEIEFYSSDFNEWHTAAMTNIIGLIDNVDSYRIKPEQKFRPFASAEECWAEMQKHQPFGWVKSRGRYFSIVSVDDVYAYLSDNYSSAILLASKNSYNDNTFADGTPFGVKVEG